MTKQKKNQSRIRVLFDQNAFRRQFEAAYNKNFDKLYVYAKTITNSEETAKDVVADVFFNLWNMRSGFSEIKELDSYLFVSVRNLSIRAISKDPKNFVSIDFENSLKSIEKLNPEDLLLEKELLDVIEKSVNKLPDQCQLVFSMVKDKQLKHSEVAEELGISESTVKNHVIKALAHIRKEVSYHLRDSGISFEYTRLGIAALFLAQMADLTSLNG